MRMMSNQTYMNKKVRQVAAVMTELIMTMIGTKDKETTEESSSKLRAS